MPFVDAPGIPGKIYVPDTIDEPKKHPCQDCFSCQWCDDSRCESCLERPCCKNKNPAGEKNAEKKF